MSEGQRQTQLNLHLQAFPHTACFQSTFSTLQSLLREMLIPSCNILVFNFDHGSLYSLPLKTCLQALNLDDVVRI